MDTLFEPEMALQQCLIKEGFVYHGSQPSLTAEVPHLIERLSGYGYALRPISCTRHIYRIATLERALANLVDAKALAGVRELVAGWNGEHLDVPNASRHHNELGATLPKTNCGAVYALDDAMVAARTVLAKEQS